MSNSQPSPSNTSDNPLFDKLSPDQIQASIKFYEADHELTHEDRVQLSKDLQNMVGKSNITALGGAIVGSLTPTIYYRFIKKQLPKGSKMLVYPGFSFCLGVANMIVIHGIYGKHQFTTKQQEEENIKLKRVWDAMDYRSLAFFYLYYIKSSTDPNAIMKDPRKITREDIYGVRIDPKMSEKVEPGKSEVHDEYASRWNEIRQREFEHEYERQREREHVREHVREREHDDDIFGFDKPKSDNSEDTHQSSWDKIRSSSK